MCRRYGWYTGKAPQEPPIFGVLEGVPYDRASMAITGGPPKRGPTVRELTLFHISTENYSWRDENSSHTMLYYENSSEF